MPYITQDKRTMLDDQITDLLHTLVGMEMDDPENNTEGNINYLITRLMMMVYGDRDSTRYSQINDAIGVLECIKLEFYRKVAAPYEDQKEFDNGFIDIRLNQEPEVVGTVEVTADQVSALEELTQTAQEQGFYDEPIKAQPIVDADVQTLTEFYANGQKHR